MRGRAAPGERLPVEVGAGFERPGSSRKTSSSRRYASRPPWRIASSSSCRSEVGVERERLRGPDLGHPRLHIAPSDPDEVGPVVDAQAVGVDLVHQVAGLTGVQPLGDHRLIADRKPTSTSRCSALLPRGVAVRSQQSATDPNRTCASAWCASVAGFA